MSGKSPVKTTGTARNIWVDTLIYPLPHKLPSRYPWIRHLNSSCCRGAAQWPTVINTRNSDAGQGWKQHACSVAWPLIRKGEKETRWCNIIADEDVYALVMLCFVCSGHLVLFLVFLFQNKVLFLNVSNQKRPDMCLFLSVGVMPAQFLM